MKSKQLILLTIVSALLFSNWITPANNWLSEKHNGYTLMYTTSDKMNIREYNKLVVKGIASVKTFFSSSYNKEFNIFIHPNRHSLDSAWQKDWNIPEFKSECWMTASGVALKLDMISPKLWDKEACEHIYSERKKTQQLIRHELVHVYHGQQNISPDFSNVEGIDWFVEGLATFASGQCDALKIAEVKKAIRENTIPKSVDNFWTGKIRYALSGSLVMFIDHKYGRAKLKELLPLSKKSEVLLALQITESELLDDWKEYILNL
jgi:hypothetical protein